MSEKQPVISIAGTGNVAYHLGCALRESFRVSHILGRNPERGEFVATKAGAQFTDNPSDLTGSDLIFCCYADDSLQEQLPVLSKLAPVASTSGTVDVLPLGSNHPIGVFYPLQSFSGNEAIPFTGLPVFIEASSEELEKLLFDIAAKLGANPVRMNAEERVRLHVAAVFTNNFTNHIISLAQDFAAANNISYDYFLPLLDRTIAKLHVSDAKVNQTGPAKRNDRKTIEKHLALLDGDKRKIYQLLSESIQKQNS